jgi:hypothetical protein
MGIGRGTKVRSKIGRLRMVVRAQGFSLEGFPERTP